MSCDEEGAGQRSCRNAGALAWKLDHKGLVIPVNDVVIVASAIAIGAAVLTSDAHFKRIEELRVISSVVKLLPFTMGKPIDCQSLTNNLPVREIRFPSLDRFHLSLRIFLMVFTT